MIYPLISLVLVSTTLLLSGCLSTKSYEGEDYKEIDVSQIEDPVPEDEPKSKYGNPKTYEVFGKTYYVRESGEGFEEEGKASWYGHPFHGRRTSSGEQYDMYEMTAAHKTLPIPCYVRVTNLKTGKSVVVRVNDRGPFHDDRVIDLSYAAAKKLGMHGEGTVPVKIQVVTPAEHQSKATPASSPRQMPALTSAGATTYLQVAAFSQRPSAESMVHRLQQLANNPGTQIVPATGYGQTLYRVRVGPFADSYQAQEYIGHITRVYPDVQPIVIK